MATGMKSNVDEMLATSNIFSKSITFLLVVEKMEELCKGKEINWPEVYDQEKQTVKSDYLVGLFQQVSRDIQQEAECPIKSEALGICDKGISTLTELGKYAPEGKCDDAKTEELIKAIDELNVRAMAFYSKSKSFTNQPSFLTAPPKSSQQQIYDSANTDVVQMHLRQSHLRLQMAETQLKIANERNEKTMDNLDQKKKALAEIVSELKHYNLKEIDFNKRIVVLAKGLEIMGQVKEQWEKLVHFFQIISNIVKTTLSENLKHFKQTVEIAVENNYTYSMFVKDKIYTNALNASAYAYLVNMMSTTYTEVSVQYLMNNVSTLGRLMTMDPNSPQFLAEIDKLGKECESAQNGINSLAARNRKEFYNRCEERITQIKTILTAALAPLSEKDNLNLKKAIDAMKEPIQKVEEDKPATEMKAITEDDADQYA
ncbi:uncharacterized protein LOC118241238 [Electrophorus electricus]|uniref:uncharacterized protein LOC118241238 n=1 Tax=Electrophorus electricus TaxID=8005 RepID=UPI0015D0375A|nr:uncharacterized protein LOC118241238 [Electrophorus electricus]